MSWRAITEADLLTRISGAELQTFRQAVLAAGQADPVQPVFDQVTDQVRGYVAGCPANKLGPDGTIPVKLLGPTLALCVMEVMARCGGRIVDPGEHRRQSARDAYATLKDVAACVFKLDVPQEFTDEKIGVPPPSYQGATFSFGRSLEEGL